MPVSFAGAPAIGRRYWIAAFLLVAVMAAILLWMGRPAICTCGTVELWVAEVHGPDNSQHLADWYTPSHVIHGFLFYAVGRWLMHRRPVGERYVMAVALEAAWELLENSPMIIERYRAATFAFGYNGDSVLNSVADIGWMCLGFVLARRLPFAATVTLAIAFELLALAVIRDNLTLNVVMLIAPVDAIKAWQAG
jgi:hypothetical protein